MENKSTMHLGGSGNNERIPLDLYETPEFFIKELLKYEQFDNNILEPCCGNGRISKTLIDNNYNVRSCDIVKRSYECEERDFLDNFNPIESSIYDIVTNPPYSLMNKFIYQATLIAKNKFAFVGRIQLLESTSRYNLIYKEGCNGFRLKKILVSTKRLQFITEDAKFRNGSPMCSCWFIFERNYSGDAIIKWVNFD